MMFLKGDELFVVESLSIYSGDPADTEFNAGAQQPAFTA